MNRYLACRIVALTAIMLTSCSSPDRTETRSPRSLTDLERTKVAEAEQVVLVECMAAAGFPSSAEELSAEVAPARFDGEAYLAALFGGPDDEDIPQQWEAALALADAAERGRFDPKYACVQVARTVAPVRALGEARAELFLSQPGSTEEGLLTRMLADPTIQRADAIWRDCLAGIGVDASAFQTLDDLTALLNEVEVFVSDTRPEVRESDRYATSLASLTALRAADTDCNPAYAIAIEEYLGR